MRAAPSVILSDYERRKINARKDTVSARLQRRFDIVLLAGDGMEDIEIGAKLGISRQMAARWRQRYLEGGVIALEHDLPRSGRTKIVDEDLTAEILRKFHEKAPSGKKWSSRTLAPVLGVSGTTIRSIWRAHGLSNVRLGGGGK